MLPLRLPGERMTAILEEKVDEVLDRLEQRIDNIFPDDVFPGTHEVPPAQRLTDYLLATPVVGDLALILNPDYPDMYKAGLAPAPQSPYWVTALSIPSEFRKLSRDFAKLLQKDRAA